VVHRESKPGSSENEAYTLVSGPVNQFPKGFIFYLFRIPDDGNSLIISQVILNNVRCRPIDRNKILC
jgi:hypothetical protein